MLLDIFTHDFMLRALAAGVVTAVIAPTIGMFLVTRRYAFLADTLAHVSLAGVAIGILMGFQPIVTAVGTSIIGALAADELRLRRKLAGESALALFLSGGLAVAAILLSLSKNSNVNISSILFGSITTVTQQDVALILGLGIATLSTVFLLWRPLFLTSIDEDLAAASGLPVGLLSRILVILAAVTVSLSLRIVGVLLVGALMVIPVLAAMQLRLGFVRTYLVAVLIALLSVIGGLILSYELDIGSGGTIVLLTLFGFVACGIVGHRKQRRA